MVPDHTFIMGILITISLVFIPLFVQATFMVRTDAFSK